MWGPALFAPTPDEAPQPVAFASCAPAPAPASDPMTDDEQDVAAAPPLAAVVNPVRRDDHVVLPATPQPPSSTSLWGSFRGPVASPAASGQWPTQSWQPNPQHCCDVPGPPDANSTSLQWAAQGASVVPRDGNSTSQLGTSQHRTPNAPIKTRNVYVGALPLSFTDADLAALLSEFGKVKSCRMFNTGARVAEIGRAYGFGLFEQSGAAERAVACLDGKPLGNARIQCQLSRNGVVKKPKASPSDSRGVQPPVRLRRPQSALPHPETPLLPGGGYAPPPMGASPQPVPAWVAPMSHAVPVDVRHGTYSSLPGEMHPHNPGAVAMPQQFVLLPSTFVT